MGKSLVGSLLRFDANKRSLFHPNAPEYPEFDGEVGLCVSHRVNSQGNPHVGVQWLKPVAYRGRKTARSGFALDNFVVFSALSS